MAIKRPSKSLGTPVRKTVSSPGLRHVDIRIAHQMVPGESYLGWLCKNKACGRVIAIAVAQAGSKPAAAEPDPLTQTTTLIFSLLPYADLDNLRSPAGMFALPGRGECPC